ncbi:MAG: signal recognition particle-docking protein FtsY [Synechococcales bacterium]|nr:signal recognition particle-docking protein FtsY [Synechococcales bacterium]
MPPFDWFKRRFGNPSSEAAPEAPPASDESAPETSADTPPADAPPAASETEPAAAPTVSQDYLSWAKAAYQNIQQQRTQTEAAPSETTAPSEESTELAPEDRADAIAEPEFEPVAPEAIAEQPAVEPVAEPEPAPPEAAGDEAAVASEVGEPETEEEVPAPPEAMEPVAPPPVEAPTAVPSPMAVSALQTSESQTTPDPATADQPAAAPLPFWAQADAERQARLERLKATAIEEPEPVQPAAATTPAPTAPPLAPPDEIELGEDFLWSARVLAEQGRRPDEVSLEEIDWLTRLRQGLGKTRRGLINQLRSVVGQGPLNQDAVMEIESLLLQADVGIEATDYVINALQQRLKQEALPPEAAIAYLKEILRDILEKPYENGYTPNFAPERDTLNIWLITGVNGAGKTTTIGKLAHLAQKSEYRCLIAAADTIRAAAVEQVKVWGQRSNTEVIANPGKNTDPAAVVFDGITAAQSRGIELLLVDTAGRLQNKKNLMEELSKIRRIIDKKAPDAHIESLLVLDATLGQNGLRQAEVFSEAANLSGVVLTKLDGTAKGGVALAVVQQLGLPIRFLGAGEGIEDLRPFSSYEFVEALLSG